MIDEPLMNQLLEQWKTGQGRESGSHKPQCPDPDLPFMDKCPVCGKQQMHYQCSACIQKLGHHLYKACCDPFDYAIGLKNGCVIHATCEVAEIRGDWVFITGIEKDGTTLPFSCPRGMQVRLSEIAWVADAPNGC